jgi:creatinine amidohydrolase
LAARRWPELQDRRPLLLVPLGSCEQHGPHLPLGTDTLIAEAVAERVAALAPDECAVAPPVTFGASGEHAGFPGTLSIGTEALTSLLVELVRSADHFDGVVLVNGHGGNRDAVTAAVGRAHADGRSVLAWWPVVAGGDAHAGRIETSLVLAVAPDEVDAHRMAPGRTEPFEELWPALRAAGVAAVSPNGVLGDPRGASAAEGERLLSDLVRSCSEAIARWREVGRPSAGRAPRG